MVAPLDVALRVAGALIGGYALAYAGAALLALSLPTTKPDAVLISSMLSFAFHAGAVLWCLAAATPARAWLGLAPAFSLMGLAFWFAPP